MSESARAVFTGLLSLALSTATLTVGVRAAHAQMNESIASPPGTIRVVGEATVTAKPDLAELDLGVISEAKTAEAAAPTTPRGWRRSSPC